MRLREITGTFLNIDGTPASGKVVTFEMDDGDFTDTEQVQTFRVDFVLDENGALPAGTEIWANDDGYLKSPITCYPPDKQKFDFVMPYSVDPITINALRLLGTTINDAPILEAYLAQNYLSFASAQTLSVGQKAQAVANLGIDDDFILDAEFIYADDATDFAGGDTISEFADKTVTKFGNLYPAGGDGSQFWANDGTFKTVSVDLTGLATETFVNSAVATRMLKTANLSDLSDAGAARTNLGLGSVNNTSDADKPISTATQTALNLLAPKADPTFSGVARFADGSASVPSIAGTGDYATTGFHFDSSPQDLVPFVGVTVDGTTHARFYSTTRLSQSVNGDGTGFARIEGELIEEDGYKAGVVIEIDTIPLDQTSTGKQAAAFIAIRGSSIGTQDIYGLDVFNQGKSTELVSAYTGFSDGGTGTTPGMNTGGLFGAKDSDIASFGSIHYATGNSNPTPAHIGLIAYAKFGTTHNVAGYFTSEEAVFPYNQLPALPVSATVIVNNAEEDQPIFAALHNGAIVFLIDETGNIEITENVTGLTASMVGLGSVNDTADLDKPISTLTQTALNLKEDLANKNQANGYAGLDSNGYLDSSAIPALKSHEFIVVADQAARLALTTAQVQLGDEAFQTDTGETYKLISADPSSGASWQVVADTTPDWSAIQNKPSSFASTWGSISGTLTDQTDLNTALGLLAPKASPQFSGFVGIGAGTPEVALHVFGTNGTSSSVYFERNVATTGSASLIFRKNRSGAVAVNDLLGLLSFAGNDGSGTFFTSSRIFARVDAITTAGSVKSSLVFNSTGAGTDDALVLTSAKTAIFGGSIQVATIADASAPNSSLYYSSDQSRLVWKNSDGVSGNISTKATYNAQTGTTYTILTSDLGKIIVITNAGAITVTIPTGLGSGFNCIVRQGGAGQITFANSGTTLTNAEGHTKTAKQYATVTLDSADGLAFALNGNTGV